MTSKDFERSPNNENKRRKMNRELAILRKEENSYRHYYRHLQIMPSVTPPLRREPWEEKKGDVIGSNPMIDKMISYLTSQSQKGVGLETISVGEASYLLGVSRDTVYRLLDDGKIPYYRIRRLKRVKESDVVEYLKKNRKHRVKE